MAAQAMLSPTPLTLVKGYAGTGKTFTLGEVARVWQARGFEVLGGAASGKATQELGGLQGHADRDAGGLAGALVAG